jgi:hypothetical protein
MAVTKISVSKKKALTSISTTKPKAAFMPIDATKKSPAATASAASKDGSKKPGKRARTVTKWSKEEVQFVLESIIKYHDKRQNRYKISLFTTIASIFEPKFNITVEGDQMATIFKSVKKSYNHFLKLTTNPQFVYDTEKALIILPLEIYNSNVKQDLRLLSHIAVKQSEDHVEITFPYFSIMQKILKTNDFTSNTSNINNYNNNNSNNSKKNNNNAGHVMVQETPGPQHQHILNGQIDVVDNVESSQNDTTAFAGLSGPDQSFGDGAMAAMQPGLNHHHHNPHHQLELPATSYKDPFADHVNALPHTSSHPQSHPQQHQHSSRLTSQRGHPQEQQQQQQQPMLPLLPVNEENNEFQRKVLQLIDLWNIERKTHTDTIATLQDKIDLTNKAVLAIDYKLDKVLEYLKRKTQ